jgi:16S rRNA (adenine1518-N6/adenine1519-N6)-dimethyltransferase
MKKAISNTDYSTKVKPKKHLGQHFLRDESIAKRIVDSLTGFGNYKSVVEVGPGTGVLSKYLMQLKDFNWIGMDVDTESIAYLRKHYPAFEANILEKDILKTDLAAFGNGEKIAIIGNFPYNISSQILFKILEHRNDVAEMVGMFQKEVALRVVAKPGGRTGGILSILCQAFYDVELLFSVSETVFDPPPKVKSAVIRFRRNQIEELPCNERLFFVTVKTAFNQRRKTLRNALKVMQVDWAHESVTPLADKRAEQLSVDEFIRITHAVKQS